jgi:hypothetical protein
MEMTVRSARCVVRGGFPWRIPCPAHLAPIVLMLLAGAAGKSPAQAAGQGSSAKPWFVSVSHYGKWATLAGAGALLAQGALRHRDANRVFASLTERCSQTPGMCNQSPDGDYLEPEIIAIHQRSKDLRHSARTWILAGEASLLAAGAMFLVDVLYNHEEPKNIPYSPFSVFAHRDRIGLSARF